MDNVLQGQLFGDPVRAKSFGESRQSMISQATRVMLQSESNEWYTPPKIIEAARAVLGGIGLDPASSPEANEVVKAEFILSADDNGLRWQWHTTVWLNPPYGKTNGQSNQEIWLRYLEGQYCKGNVAAAIALTRAAVGYHWFSKLWRRWPVCITDNCISFIRPAGGEPGKNTGKSKTASALWYFGPDVELFKRKFGQFGRVLLPEHLTIKRSRRIQRKRLGGWRMVEQSQREIVYVGRPTKWGNPFDWKQYPAASDAEKKRQAKEDFAAWLDGKIRDKYPHQRQWILDHEHELTDKNVACWCGLDQPCHGDVYLERQETNRG